MRSYMLFCVNLGCALKGIKTRTRQMQTTSFNPDLSILGCGGAHLGMKCYLSAERRPQRALRARTRVLQSLRILSLTESDPGADWGGSGWGC